MSDAPKQKTITAESGMWTFLLLLWGFILLISVCQASRISFENDMDGISGCFSSGWNQMTASCNC